MKMKNQKFLTIIFLISLLFLSFPFFTKAGLVPCGLSEDDPNQPGDQTVPCQFCHLFVLFENIVNFVIFDLALPLTVLLIAIAGFFYIFAYLGPEEGLIGGQGAPALLLRAKKILSSVIFGLIIIFAAWLLVGLFLQVIGLASWTEKLYKNWWKQGLFQIECPTK